jgi:alpha/beta superfamily hydrolase
MPRKLIYLVLLGLLVLLTNSCDTGGEGGGEIGPDTPVLKVLGPTAVSETGFQLNWSITNPVGFETILILVAEDKEMTEIVRYVEEDDKLVQNVPLNGLDGATKYFYRISLMNQGVTVTESEIKSVETSYKLESTSLVTEDDYTLSAKLAYLESIQGKRPGIIMMHEFGVWVNPWISADLTKQLVADGYVCLTFFFRGHGTSTPVDDLMDLINDKSWLAKDLQAAIDFMKEHEQISDNLGLIGGSMGAIAALAGNGYEEVLTSVALSPTRDGVFLLFPDMTLSSVYYLAGELDIRDQQGADFPAEANALYDLTEEPRKLNIIPGTSDHGTNLLSRDSLNISIEDWFLATLPLQ